ncbi:bifunctional chorismate mutase/prephenate dehydratase [Zongyangia hominis]|uniref:Bifunctional chorismate mutase/prephenate dehydratase n=1 Tax=Zongyangia hominis TaxID=2763677 RepID=A0A926EG05_9FIRM|nr:bifunctional chorismate mutase/prephenate dehydratase [Zongyangia hominis]MBC8571151.1 chorismate mutase [Zongyangia hominis]
MDLTQLRQQIDEVDGQIVELFKTRMALVDGVARYKREHSIPVLHAGREEEVLDRAAKLAGPELAGASRVLFTTLMDVSKGSQYSQNLPPDSKLLSYRDRAKEPFVLPSAARVGCQGVMGAYSSIAARRMFPQPDLRFYRHFADVFDAVDQGEIDFGVLPIENSSAGSVGEVYDLMKAHDFSIAAALKLRIDHCLVAKDSMDIGKITKVYSHEQGINQCRRLFDEHPHLEPEVFSNTAAAAEFVSKSTDGTLAAISSKETAELYGLKILKENVQDNDFNFTRFIIITKDFVRTADADKISLSLVLPHRAGSLYHVITRFAVLGLNLTKLESRPIPGRDFEFRFYFDFEGSILDDKVLSLLHQLDQQLEYFSFLGNFHEHCR